MYIKLSNVSQSQTSHPSIQTDGKAGGKTNPEIGPELGDITLKEEGVQTQNIHSNRILGCLCTLVAIVGWIALSES